jgi:anti-sigma factor RsiW
MTEVAVHPSLDEIADYHAGTLPPAEEARIQDHLVECRRCTALLLERDELAREIEASEPAAPGEDAEAWEALRARLPRFSPGDEPSRRVEVPARLATPVARPERRSPRWLPAIAASLLVATLGLTVWSVSLSRRLAEVSQPQLNAPIHEVTSGPLRGSGEAAVLELAHGTRFYTLVLRPSAPPPPGEWEVEIARPDGTVEWRGQGLRPNEHGSFSLTLSRGLVGEGEHVIRLRGSGEAAQDEYRLRIVARR